ncbi:MAG: SLATT domain-containing protein, partial [Pseudomonadota bacterium]
QIWAAAATPLLIGATEILPEIETLLKLASLAAASATVVATGVLRVRQHWQQGVIYRGRQEALIRELQLWEHDAGRYAPSGLEKAKTDKDTLLVETCEGIIADDVSDWTNRMKDATSRVSADE